MGDFFRRLDTLFRKRGARTYRIGLNAGDRIFSHADSYIAYRGRPEEWEEFLRDFLEKRYIDKIFLFGDCRFYQRVAVALAKELNIDLFVFELGYVRPDYVTMERYGVNDYSLVSRDPSFYREMELIVNPEPIPARPSRF